jgi:hypothetical protein
MKSMQIVDYINMHLLKRLFTSVNILNASSMLLVFTTYRAASCDKKFNLILACNITEYEITPPYLIINPTNIPNIEVLPVVLQHHPRPSPSDIYT